MSLAESLKNQKTNIRQLSERSGVSYASVYDIAKGRVSLSDCKYSTVRKLADALGVSTDFLVQTDDFRHFRDQLHTELRQEGAQTFLIEQLSNDSVTKYYKAGHTARAMYVLCLTDYLCGLLNVPVPAEYEYLRCRKLTPPLRIAMWNDADNTDLNYIPLFKQHGILEGDIFDSV